MKGRSLKMMRKSIFVMSISFLEDNTVTAYSEYNYFASIVLRERPGTI